MEAGEGAADWVEVKDSKAFVLVRGANRGRQLVMLFQSAR